MSALQMESIIETMQARISCRTYSANMMADETKDRLDRFLRSNTEGFFGNEMGFQLGEAVHTGSNKSIRWGTYGFIRGATLFIIGWIRPGPGAAEDFGYAMQKNILKATEMGLGTCWVGGTFRRNAFSTILELGSGIMIPAISPVGFPVQRKTGRDKFMRWGAGSDRRKSFDALFFQAGSTKPLSEVKQRPYSQALECVRWAPSASNRQPWRVHFDAGHRRFDFFLERTKGYERPEKAVPMQNVDMGIAMCHFELAARSLGKRGRWNTIRDVSGRETWEYIVSWEDGKVKETGTHDGQDQTG